MQMDEFRICAAIAVCAATIGAAASVPEIVSCSLEQVSKNNVKIAYELQNGPAVVTLDIQTNATDGSWVSIGGRHIQTFAPGSSVWKSVESGIHTIRWNPSQDWPGHKVENNGLRAVVTAWALDNTPNYMVVDISSTATANSQRYYPDADFVPGGVLSNSAYRTTMLLMRKVPAKGVTFAMGSVSEPGRTSNREKTHTTTLTNNFYLGVFEVTQTQYAMLAENFPCDFKTEGAMRPANKVSFNELRHSTGVSTNATYNWPAAPYSNSYLGKLRTKTGLDFDLPSERQWEYACRAGHGEGYWNNGAAIISTDSGATDGNLPGRYKAGGGYIDGTTAPSGSCGPENGPAICGSYEPNAWGFYDMHGNVREWCLDWWTTDGSTVNGINISPANPGNTLSGATGEYRVVRDGSWGEPASSCRSAYRNCLNYGSRNWMQGFRLACRAGLD